MTRWEVVRYERLAATAQTRAALALRPHAHAAADVTAQELFAGLRGDDRPTGTTLADLTRAAQRMRGYDVDVAGIRRAGPDTWLLPGPDAVCLAVTSSPEGLTAGCTSLDQARDHGVAVGVAGAHARTTIVVPDDATAVTVGDERFAAEGHVVVIPRLVTDWTLAKD